MSTLYQCKHHGEQEHTYGEVSHRYCGCDGTAHTACRPADAPEGTPRPEGWPVFLGWQTATSPADPLAGPFMTGRQMLDSSNDEGYATTIDPDATAPSRARQLREEAIGR